MKVDYVIVGAGLFGSATAKYLAKQGFEVAVIDSDELLAASKCSAGVFKESWVGQSIKQYVNESIPVLDEMYGIYTIEYFNMDKDMLDTMYKVDCQSLLQRKFSSVFYVNAKVAAVNNDFVTLEDGEIYKANKAVIIAAGGFTDSILSASGYLPMGIDIYWGATMEFKMNIDMSRYKTWAPYKQSLLVKETEDKFTFSDGCAVKNPSSGDKRVAFAGDRLIQHATDIIGLSTAMEHCTSVKEGNRPYLPKTISGKYVQQHDKKLFTATGGAKNSTILSGHVALMVHRQTMLNL